MAIDLFQIIATEMADIQDRAHPGFTLEEHHKAWSRVWSSGACLHFSGTCTDETVDCHSVSARWLRTIANERQEVLQLDLRYPLVWKRQGQPVLVPQQVTKASTFPGFCSLHDNELFSVFENGQFALEHESVGRAAYRAICREAFVHRATAGLVAFHNDDTNEAIRQIARRHFVPESYLTPLALDLTQYIDKRHVLKRSSQREKVEWDNILREDAWDRVKFAAFECEPALPWAMTTVITPKYCPMGKRLQMLVDPPQGRLQPPVAVFTVHQSDRCYIVFACREGAYYAKQYLQKISALSDADFSHLLFGLLSTYIENAFISMNWWNQLASTARERLLQFTMLETKAGILIFNRVKRLGLPRFRVRTA